MKKKTKILLVVVIAILLIIAVNLIWAVLKAEKIGLTEDVSAEKPGGDLAAKIPKVAYLLTKPVVSSTALIALTAGLFIAKIAREENDSD